MTKYKFSVAFFGLIMMLATYANAVDPKLRAAIDLSDQSSIVEKDWLKAPTKYKMPKNCVTTDKKSIQRGKFFFHNLNGKKIKGKNKVLAKNLGINLKSKHKKLMKPYGGWKAYGNCIACHNIETANAPGNIGPDLSNYKAYFIDSGARSAQWVYQKVADPRIDNPNSHMEASLTSGKLFNEDELCDIVSYLLIKK